MTETLRAYARIFEKKRRDSPRGPLRPPGEISIAVAKCCRIIADAIDRGDPYLPPEWRK